MIVTELAWLDRAACRGLDTKLFFPERGNIEPHAKRVCDGCDVRPECLAYALGTKDMFGTWGGTSARQRQRLRTQRRLALVNHSPAVPRSTP